MQQNYNQIIKHLLAKKIINRNQLLLAENIADTLNKPIEQIMLEKGFLKETVLFELFSKYYTTEYSGIIDKKIRERCVIVKEVFDKINIPSKNFDAVLFQITDKDWKAIMNNPKQKENFFKMGFTENDQKFIITPKPFTLNEENKLRKMKSFTGNKNLKVFFRDSYSFKRMLLNNKDKLHYVQNKLIEINKMEVEVAVSEGKLDELLNDIILYSIEQGVSDIHIEPYNDVLGFRLRLDGILVYLGSLKFEYNESVFNLINGRTKDNNIDRAKPLDGQFTIEHNIFGSVNLRWGENKTIYGSHIVIRILNSDVQGLTLDNINYKVRQQKLIKLLLKEPNGIFLITGPTGSGKTNTLAAILKEISKPETKILSLEDPVEIKLPIIQQVQVQNKAKLTVQRGLKSFLRQDPDIMFIGEIRDTEMATKAVEGAMTGHLMLATLHTNDALSSIIRLQDLGIEDGHIANSLKCVIAQRLLRTLCSHCKIQMTKEDLENDELRKRFSINVDLKNVYTHNNNGCEHCRNSGYLGRKPIAEIFVVDKYVQNLILKKTSLNEITENIKNSGYKDLKRERLEYVETGETDLHEVVRVLGMNNSDEGFNYESFNLRNS